VLTFVAALALAGWLYLVFFRGGFWRADQTLPPATAINPWPGVAAVIPARDEAPSIAAAVASLLGQDYSGAMRVVVVDDGSTDGTADAARAAAARIGAEDRLTVIEAPPLPAGWSGKLWAVHNGLLAVPDGPRYVLLTDADIVHAPDALRRLVAKAENGGRDLVSLMVKLHCESFAERLLIPAFVFFFQKLYPFPWVNDRANKMAGAAGGCMLVRRTALTSAGGIEGIKSALIDDCALAAALKKKGAIWLGLADKSASIRRYPRVADIWRMVARTAYTQLRHAPAMVAGTVFGMALLYLVPPMALLLCPFLGAWMAAAMGAASCALMLYAYRPTWELYRGDDPAILLLPLAALLYTAMTVDSALQHHRGKGGAWKGRTYPAPSPPRPPAA